MCRITVNINDNEKVKVQKILAKSGISMSGAVRLYFEAIIKEGAISKAIDPFYSPENMKELEKRARRVEKRLHEIYSL